MVLFRSMRSEFHPHLAVLDLETLAKASNSVILSLGMTVTKYTDKDATFKSLLAGGLYLKFDIKQQLAMKRTTEKSTVAWWREQDPVARKVLNPSPSDVSVLDLPMLMGEYFDDIGVDIKKVDFYDRNSFDMSKLQDLFENNLDTKVTWDYKHVFEIATMLRYQGYDRYAGMHVSDVEGAVYHNALHDAAVDHLRILKVLHAPE